MYVSAIMNQMNKTRKLEDGISYVQFLRVDKTRHGFWLDDLLSDKRQLILNKRKMYRLLGLSSRGRKRS